MKERTRQLVVGLVLFACGIVGCGFINVTVGLAGLAGSGGFLEGVEDAKLVFPLLLHVALLVVGAAMVVASFREWKPAPPPLEHTPLDEGMTQRPRPLDAAVSPPKSQDSPEDAPPPPET